MKLRKTLFAFVSLSVLLSVTPSRGADYEKLLVMEVGQEVDEVIPLNENVNTRANPIALRAELECSTYFGRYELRILDGTAPEGLIFHDFVEPVSCFEARKKIRANYRRNRTSCLMRTFSREGYPSLNVEDGARCEVNR